MGFLRKYIVVAAAVALLQSCTESGVAPDYREEMRDFVIAISNRGEELKPGFIVVPQNGLQLLSTDAIVVGQSYVDAIDGVGQEELFYGYDNQNNFLSENYEEQAVWLSQCRFARNTLDLTVMVTDYCSAPDLVTDSYNRCDAEGFLDFTAASRELDLVPASVHNENTNNIDSLSHAQNFLFMINPTQETKEEYLVSLETSHHDVLIIDAFFAGNEALTTADLARLRNKPQGGRRIVLSYMSIGQAESYRWYWKPFWMATPPSFVLQEDPYWNGNFYVNYWNPTWQHIICGNDQDSYVNRVVAAGFDGVYLDLVNAFEFFEDK